jgi:predicted HicB family RNase H-like nuclease
MIDAADYTISVQRGDFDGEVCFEARVRELPHLAEYGDSSEEAYALAIDSIETTFAVLAEKGKQMPPPQVSASGYSGRVTLRLPRTLHRELSHNAVEEGVSLNQHIVSSLSFNAGA